MQQGCSGSLREITDSFFSYTILEVRVDATERDPLAVRGSMVQKEALCKSPVIRVIVGDDDTKRSCMGFESSFSKECLFSLC
jgi:hypothetical protein